MERMPFWIALEEEIAAAEINGRAVIIQFDANARLGKQHIKNGPKEISENGKVLAGILDRSQKRQNICDNLFVMNAITNEAKQQIENACDVGVYDIKKCHDNLWLHECINDLWDAGIQDDKLVLLFPENQNAHIAIKTACGTTEQITIHNKIMQGTVWAGLMCTTSMDKLGKEVYNDPTLIYKFRDKVAVPPLEMVDDIITASNCGTTTVALNAKVNSFLERKKLELSFDKCSRTHVGPKAKSQECHNVKVHEEDMKNAEKENYLGDYVTKQANSNETLISRKTRAFAILAEIKALLNEIPLGNRKVEVGLALREAWLISVRRMLYLKRIIDRDENELIRKEPLLKMCKNHVDS